MSGEISAKSVLIRQAKPEDICRITEIFVFNNRLNYFPIFKDEDYSFNYLTVESVSKNYPEIIGKLENTYVFDDGILRGFVNVEDYEIKKLYVDSFFQGRGIGSELLKYAAAKLGAKRLMCLEKNKKAMAFYLSHGFK